jgi:hypothetical protein
MDEKGCPIEITLPYQVDFDFIEEHGFDIPEANAEPFVSLEDLTIYITDIVTRGRTYG